jgi:hypothetical protein
LFRFREFCGYRLTPAIGQSTLALLDSKRRKSAVRRSCWLLILPVALVLVSTAVAFDAAGVVAAPVVFEPNQGQAQADVRFLSRAGGYLLTLQDDAVAFHTPQGMVLLRFAGSHGAALAGEQPTGGTSNYFHGNDPTGWIRSVPHFAAVRYRELYPGIDAVFYARGGELEFDFILNPGAAVDDIRIAVAGGRWEELPDGAMALVMGEARWVLRPPAAFQEIAGERRPVRVGYRRSGQALHLATGPYDGAHPLIIDPVISFSSYFGAFATRVEDIAVDAGGNMYLVGTTASASFPVLNPHQGTRAGEEDLFLTKIAASGTIAFSTYFGGSRKDEGIAVAVDPSGNPVVGGQTKSSDFPVTGGPVGQPCQNACYDPFPFAAKFSSQGSLTFAVLLTVRGLLSDIAVAPDGGIVAAGYVFYGELIELDPLFEMPPTPAYYTFLLKLQPSGDAFVFSTYLPPWVDGFPYSARTPALAVDPVGNIYLARAANRVGFPLQGAIDSDLQSADILVAKISADGQALLKSTYWGGSGVESVSDVGVDTSGNVVVVGVTFSRDFPLTENAVLRDCADLANDSGGAWCSYAVRLAADFQSVSYSTYLGGGGEPPVLSVAGDGTAHIAGVAQHPLLPPVQAVQRPTAGLNTYVLSVDVAGRLRFSSYYGGEVTTEAVTGIAHRGTTLYLAGSLEWNWAAYPDLPLVLPLISRAPNFVARISPIRTAALVPAPSEGPYVLLRNLGSEPLEILSVTSATLPLSGDCRGTLLPGDFCPVGVPVPGNLIGYLDIASNLPDSPHRYIFQARWAQENVFLRTEPLRFLPQTVLTENPQPQYVTVHNLRALGLELTINNVGKHVRINHNCPNPLPRGAQCVIAFWFRPAGTGMVYGKVEMKAGEFYYTFFPGGRGIGSALDVYPLTVDFGTSFVDEPPLPRLLTVENVSTSAVKLAGFSPIGPYYTQTNDCPAVLEPRQFCNVWVTFAPSGNAYGHVALRPLHDGYYDFGGESYLTARAYIRSQLSIYSSPVFYSFLGHDAYATAHLQNSGGEPLTVTHFSAPTGITGALDGCENLAPQASCALNLTIAAPPLGVYTGEVTVYHTGSGEPQVVGLYGEVRRRLYFNTTELNFAATPVGTTLLSGFSLGINFGPLTLSPMTVVGPFSIVENVCPNPLPSYTGCWIKVAYTPTSTGSHSGSITFTDSDYPAVPYVITLQGTGVPRTRAPRTGGKHNQTTSPKRAASPSGVRGSRPQR